MHKGRHISTAHITALGALPTEVEIKSRVTVEEGGAEQDGKEIKRREEKEVQ